MGRAVALAVGLAAIGSAALAQTSSSPIVVSPNGTQVWSVNPDNDSVTLFDATLDPDPNNPKARVLAEILVGDRPQTLAINNGGTAVYVVNQGSNSVSVVDVALRRVVDTVQNVGTEPYGGALTPDGRFLYVACASSSNVYKIDVTANNQILQTVGFTATFPEANDLRGIAISADSKTVFVTQLLAELRPGVDKVLGQMDDDGKQGVVYTINVGAGAGGSDTLGPKIALLPIDSGFTQNRVQFCKKTNANAVNDHFCPDTSVTDPNSPLLTQAKSFTYPNVVQSALIVGNRMLVPSLGSSPEPPVNFNTNVQALLNVVDLSGATPTYQTGVNLNKDIRTEVADANDPLTRVFHSMPWAIGVHPTEDRAYVVVQGSNHLVKVFNAKANVPTTLFGASANQVKRIAVGKDPRGIAVRPDGKRAYVMNYVSRDVSVVNLDNDTTLGAMFSAAVPDPSSDEGLVHRGKELFNTSIGGNAPATNDPNDPNSPAFGGRFFMSDNGWGSCFNCHPFGFADGVTWSFPSGARQTVPLDGTYSQTDPSDQRILNWSAVRSSVQDFDKNTENVSGGFGLIGNRGATDLVANHGATRDRADDRGFDEIDLYVQTIAAPRAVRNINAEVARGRAIFTAENCQSCHGGSKWSKSRFAYTLPAAADPDVVFVGEDANNPGGTGELQQVLDIGLTVLDNVGTFDPNSAIEVRGTGPAIGRLSFGAAGFNSPSLLGLFRHTPYFHDGKFQTVRQTIDSGHGLTTRGALTEQQKSDLEAFLRTIDDTTPPVLNLDEVKAHSDHNSILAFSPDERYLYTANPKTDSLSVVYIAGDENRVVAEVPVGREPRSVAAHPDDQRIFVLNQRDATISVVKAPDWIVDANDPKSTISNVGVEPYGLAMTRDAKYLLVTSSGSDEIIAIDVDPASAKNGTIIARLNLATAVPVTTALGVGMHLDPRGIAVTPDSKFAVVTLFLALPSVTGQISGNREAFDNGKSGYALVVDLTQLGAATPSMLVSSANELPWLDDTGFTANRANFCKKFNASVPNETYCPDTVTDDPNSPQIARAPQGAFPNLLRSVLITDGAFVAGPLTISVFRVFFPSIGSSPEPPVNFATNIQSLVSSGRMLKTQAAPTIEGKAVVNLNRGINFEKPSSQSDLKKIFPSTLYDMRLKPYSGDPNDPNAPLAVGFALSAGSNIAVRVTANLRTGDVSIGAPADANDPGSIVRVPLGKNPHNIAITSTGARMYSYNFIGRSVTAVNISNDTTPVVLGEVQVTRRPEPGTPAHAEWVGNELFNTGIGPLAPDPNFPGRFTMSDNGWGNCFNCHPYGLADGVTWIFPTGPRQTPPLDGTYSDLNRTDQRVLNWSAVRSSTQDFEKNTENVSGGFGLIGVFGAADGVNNHLATRGRADDSGFDEINEYVRGIRSPNGLDGDPNDIAAGAVVYDRGCWSCHGGSKWSTSFVNYPLPAVSDPNNPNQLVTLVAGQVAAVNGVPLLRTVGTFDPNGPIEIRTNAAAPLGAAGFNPPALLGTLHHAPYFHDGRFQTLEQVLASTQSADPNQVHFRAGPLSAEDQRVLAAFLRSIDGQTTPFGATQAFDPNSVRPSIHSSTIAATPDGKFVLSVNPDNDSVAVFDTATDTKVYEFRVGKLPRSIAINSDGSRAYVTNQRDGDAEGRLGTVSVLAINLDGTLDLIDKISVGAEPYGCALTPNGKFLFVSNYNSGSVSVIRVSSLTVAKTIDVKFDFFKVNPHLVPYPAGIGITDDGDADDSDEKVYVTLFLAHPYENGHEGFDQGKEGHVVVLDVGAADDGSDTNLLRVVQLPGMKDSGFSASRTAFCRSNGAVNDTYCGGSSEPQGAFPGAIQSVFIRGNRAYFPSIGYQPEPPVRFNVNVQALITNTDAVHDAVTQPTFNMNVGVGNDPKDSNDPLQGLFFSAPWQLAIRTDAPGGKTVGYTVVMGGDVVVRTEFDKEGDPTVNAASAPAASSPIKRIAVGKAPQGIAILPDNSKAYVMNYVSRSVSVIDLATDTVTKEIPSASLPDPLSEDDFIHLGRELFHSARGLMVSDAAADGRKPRFEMSDNGWGSCFNCHPLGLSDGVTWIFPTGPRQVIPFDGMFGADDEFTGPGGFIPGLTQRVLNYSAVRSTNQDFEKNIENVSGGFGQIGPNGAADGVVNHGANRGLSERADALERFVSTIEAPISPFSPLSDTVVQGRQIFLQAGCDKCHSGSIWTTSRADYTLPATADPDVVFAGPQVQRIVGTSTGDLQILHSIGTFDPNGVIEVRGTPPFGSRAAGAAGFNVPAILGIAAHAPYFHDGSARDLEELMEHVGHRTAGQPAGTDIFAGAGGADNITKVVAFVKSIGEFTERVTQPGVVAPPSISSASLLTLALSGLAMFGLGLWSLRRRLQT